jgi:NAD(P)-dependent dehydrogenase (short-subunit alcohol dehydrogenase family)
MIGSFDRFGFRRHARHFVASELDLDLRGKRALVSGASSGLGYATTEALVARGATVAMLCRDQQRGEEALSRIHAAHPGARVELRRLDVASLAEVRRFCDEEPGPIDMLVHNAGIQPATRELTEEGLERTFATHVAGPHLMTALLADRLRPLARVVFVSSGGMYLARFSLHDLDWRARKYASGVAYAQTKRLQLALAEGWGERLSALQGYAYAMHPGWADTPSVKTALPRFFFATKPFLRTPAEGADTIVWLAARAVPAAPNGGFFFDRRNVRSHVLPWTRDRLTDRIALFALLDQLVGEG